MIDRKTLSPFGIGAWGIGGFAKHDPQNKDEQQIEAIAYSLQKGMNFIEVNFWNSEGYSVELFRKAVKESKVPREKIFIVQAIYDYNLETIEEVKAEFNLCLERFATSYVDTLEFPLPAFRKYGFKNLVKLIETYLSDGKIRFTSLTNANLEYLKKYHQIFKDKFFSHELCFNFEIRENEEFDITEYALRNKIINVPYQPLRRNRTALRNWPLLVELAEKYQKTQNQIILNWIVSKGFHPLIKSETISHIDENLEALNFSMQRKDLDRLTTFRVPGYVIPKIDWWMKGEGTKIHMLPNVFDEVYPKDI
jgi:diketogulonate reductase-like aldo/keto reductase